MTTDTNGTIIRQAREEDREALIKLIVHGFAEVTVHRWREQRYGVIGGRSWAEWKADDMRTIDIEHVVIAESEGRPVGFATFHVNHATGIGTVGNNAVLPAFRGHGIGGRLHARVLQLIAAAGMDFAQVSTGLEDCYKPARRMYERQGFEPLNRSIVYMMKLSERGK